MAVVEAVLVKREILMALVKAVMALPPPLQVQVSQEQAEAAVLVTLPQRDTLVEMGVVALEAEVVMEQAEPLILAAVVVLAVYLVAAPAAQVSSSSKSQIPTAHSFRLA